MPNSTATFQHKLSYVDTDSVSQTAPTFTVATAYALGAQQIGGIDVPDAAAADTAYSVAFGSIAAATGLCIENRTGQDVAVRIGGSSTTGTLVSGTATIAFAAKTGERLTVERSAGNGGTNGKLYVERSAGNVIVTSYYASGVQTADVSSVTVYNNAPISIANLGGLSLAMPAATAAGGPVSSASVILTASQSGAGTIGTKVFGDPV